jgi:L-ascorbate 6-phosphate lactonase
VSDLAERIESTQVPAGGLAIFWVAQAGFVFKTPNDKIIYSDVYLTDSLERIYGMFKRIMATPIKPEEVEADLVVSTHAHGDHLDVDAVPIIARNPRTRFIGAADCVPEYQKLGLPADKYLQIQVGQTIAFDGFSLTGVYADHGPTTPDALGIVLKVGPITVWQVGDTSYCPEKMGAAIAMKPDIIIPPINGAYGNLDGIAAARLAADSGASIAIPCHYWMFVEHNGNPAQFLEGCKQHAPKVQPKILSQGELFLYAK